MGVPKLWQELEPGCSVVSLAQLAEPAFAVRGTRGLRLGIDLSAWLFHMGRMNTIVDSETGEAVHAGANADLRMVFFRLAQLLGQGVLPVLVFDGEERPNWKRGAHVGGRVFGGRNPKVLKEMFDLMGVEWRIAPGEAEAELAAMNERGEVDCILSDDVDSFLFGAQKLIRHASKGLSSNKSKTALARTASFGLSGSQPSASQPSSSLQLPPSQSTLSYLPVEPSYDQAHPCYTASAIFDQTGLGRDQLILVALLAGGDYLPTGFKNVGNTIAVALAKGGYAEKLLDGVRRISELSSQAGMRTFLDMWRASVANELRTNENKLLSRRQIKLADELEAASDFPSIAVINFYLHPAVSSADPSSKRYQPPPRFDGSIDVAGLVGFCQRMFEWGNDELPSRFRNLLWRPLAMQALRHAALSTDGTASSNSSPLPSRGWIARVSELKVAQSTDYVPSYRVELDPASFDPLIAAALPSRDPYPIPDYSALSPSDAESARADRKTQGRTADRPKAPTTTSYRHWVPVGFAVEGNELSRAAEEWYDAAERKKREKEEKEEEKRLRAEARKNGGGGGSRSPVKKSAKARGKDKEKGMGSPSRRRIAPEDSDGEDAREAIKAEKVRRERERLVAASASKGKGKAREVAVEPKMTKSRSFLDDSDDEDEWVRPKAATTAASGKSKKAATTLRLDSSPPVVGSSSDLEVAPFPSTSRRPPKTAAPSLLSSGFTSSKPTLASAFRSTKPSASTSSQAKKPKPKPPVRDEDSDDDLFGSPSHAPPSSSTLFAASTSASPRKTSKRAIRPSASPPLTAARYAIHPPSSPTLSSASEDGGASRRTVSHVNKSGRTSESQRSPQKKRPVSSAGGKPKSSAAVIDLCDSTEAEEDEEDVPVRRRGAAQPEKEKRGGRKEVGRQESLEDFWARRKRSQALAKQGVIELSD
ncbi:hypothetical protein JCM8097_004633 [Rhodosporidiobolus ruineniae]